jgi:Domain of unknown function DUF11/CARDB
MPLRGACVRTETHQPLSCKRTREAAPLRGCAAGETCPRLEFTEGEVGVLTPRLPLLLLPPFAAIVLALALSLLAPRTSAAGSLVPVAGHPSPSPDVRPVFTGTGALLKDAGLSIVTTGPVIATDPNTTFLILNQPRADGMRDARLSLDFWSNNVLSLHLQFTLTLEPGPNVVPLTWTTAAFSPTYDAQADHLLVAQWADADGKAVDSALRSFNTFGVDPLPSVALIDSVWNIGTITQGAVLDRVFTVANVGAADLAVYLSEPGAAQPYRRLAPGDMAAYTVTLDTLALSPLPYSHTLTIRTSDPAAPTRTILIYGTLVPPAGGTPSPSADVAGGIESRTAAVFAVPERPWDRRVVVYGSVAENTSVYFSDLSSPDTAADEPCTVSDASGSSLKGVSRVCLDAGGSAFGVNGWRVLVERLDGPLMRFDVPEVISGGAAYVMRFGQRYTFGEGGAVLTVPVRVISQTHAAASMDALVTNVGLWGPVTVQVTVGNLSIYSQMQVITQPTVIHLPDFAGAIDQVLAAQPLSAVVDVPIQLTLDSAADVVLTNFSLVPARSIDVSIDPGDVVVGSMVLGYTLTEGLTAPITATVRNSGTTDSGPLVVSFYTTPATRSGERAGEATGLSPKYIRSALVPNVPAGGSAPAVIGWDTTGVTGLVTVTAVVDPFNRVPESNKANNSADGALSILARPDAAITRIEPADIQPYPNEVVPTLVVLRNSGQTDALSLTVALYEVDPSSTIDLLKLQVSGQPPAGGTPAPFGVADHASAQYRRGGLSPEGPKGPVSRTANALGLALGCALHGCIEAGSTAARNAGRFVPAGIVLLDSHVINLAAGAEVTTTLVWTTTRAGPRRLIAVVSANSDAPPPAVPNRQAGLTVFVGFRGPILIDSGGPNDRAYAPTVGYGFLGADGGVSSACGTVSYRTFRQGAGGSLQYRFDNFQPGRTYHLDLTFGECDGAGRQQRVLVNGTPLLNSVDLSDEQPHRFSLRLDPALYAGSAITLTVDDVNGRPALVSEVHVYDIDYRDVVAGSPAEQPYPVGMVWHTGAIPPAGASSPDSRAAVRDTGGIPPGRRFGYLNGTPQSFDDAPGPTMRAETGVGELRYRFDQLDPARRYALNLSFYHRFPLTPTLEVAVGSSYHSPEFTVPYSQPYAINIAIPRGAYAADGSITVSISRTDIVTGSFVNEIALEEQTLGETLTSADLMLLVLESPRSITAGVPVTYTLLVINNGPDTAGAVVLNSGSPKGGPWLSGSPSSGFCDPAMPLYCSLGAFPNGKSGEVSIVLTPTAAGALNIPLSINSATSDPYSANNGVLLSSEVFPGASP